MQERGAVITTTNSCCAPTPLFICNIPFYKQSCQTVISSPLPFPRHCAFRQFHCHPSALHTLDEKLSKAPFTPIVSLRQSFYNNCLQRQVSHILSHGPFYFPRSSSINVLSLAISSSFTFSFPIKAIQKFPSFPP